MDVCSVIIGGLIMIDIDKEKLEQLVGKVINQMGADESHKLLSITKQVEKKSPLQLFEGAKHFSKDRFFWSNVERTLTFTGVGKVKTVEAERERYTEIERKWKQLIDKAWIENDFSAIPATGIVAFGGMEFDPLKEGTELWKKFKPNQFYIPEIMFTEYEKAYFVTFNLLIHQGDTPKEWMAFLLEKGEQFLSEQPINQTQIEMIREEVIQPEEWKKSVKKAAEEVRDTDMEKIVLARELRLYFSDELNSAEVLYNLEKTQTDSYLFAFERDGDCFIGATPERLVRTEKNHLLSTCLAGTAPRGKTDEEDKRIGEDLLNDKKNRDEHHFVVEMIKDALVKTCTNVQMPESPVLHPLKNLQHLYTPVTGILKDEYSIFDVVKNLHPTPALGGTPTEAALRYIRENELLDRGWYGAPIGWVDSNQNGEFAVGIRSGLIQGDEVSLFAGCGVLADSNPEMEFEETRIKMLPLLNVLGGQHG